MRIKKHNGASGPIDSGHSSWLRFHIPRRRLFLSGVVVIICCGMLLTATGRNRSKQEASPPANQAAEYEVSAPKTILELQKFRQTTSIHIRSDKGDEGTATLVDLNPTINIWYLLTVAWQGRSDISYHLENPEPHSQRLILNSKYPNGIEISGRQGESPCNVFANASANALEEARNSRLIYAPLCEDRLFLRNQAQGYRTSLEAAVEFLRNQVWGGEKVIVLLHHLLGDINRETAETRTEGEHGTASAPAPESSNALPLGAIIDAKYSDQFLMPTNLGLTLEAPPQNGMRPGAWYSASGNPGVYVSLIQPEWIDSTILRDHSTFVNALDSVEASSLCYLVAFDLDRFDLAYERGTEHPAVGWSEHIQDGIKDLKLPGPDGIGTIAPLVSTGLIRPEDARRTVATFTGGFKREHGAFKYGDFALKNHGSHYGFLQDGVVFSKLQPGLATILVLDDGTVQIKTWQVPDEQMLAKIKYARQNGVPIVEFDEQRQATVPGRLVNNWGAGNWSGSEDRKLRTMRSGAALQWNGAKRFLIYAVFSDATPSAMARVFQAYRCRYGMLLDMNALEHTYFALYRRAGSQFLVDHLIEGMGQVDKSDANGSIPRFLGYPDNRDFFYVMRRTQ